MAVPTFQAVILPVLRLAASGETKTTDAVERLSDQFALAAEERRELLPSGRQARMANRVYWAVTYLSKAGLVNRPRRGVFGITDQGRKVLENPPSRIDMKFLLQFPGFEEFHAKGANDGVGQVEPTETLSTGTPEERVEAAFESLNATLRAELLERIHGMDPASFEKLIVDLMLGMGYGAGGSGQHLGRTGDGGVDGVINEDVLGLDIIYLQAKRYAAESVIGVEKIREFAGALDERGATKGVFVTTSSFAAPARQYAQRSPKRLVLIDGEELTRLMVKYGVAVRAYRTLEMKKVDTDYFEELDS